MSRLAISNFANTITKIRLTQSWIQNDTAVQRERFLKKQILKYQSLFPLLVTGSMGHPVYILTRVRIGVVTNTAGVFRVRRAEKETKGGSAGKWSG